MDYFLLIICMQKACEVLDSVTGQRFLAHFVQNRFSALVTLKYGTYWIFTLQYKHYRRGNTIIIIGITSYYAKFCWRYVDSFVNMALVRDLVQGLLYSASSNTPGSFLYEILTLLHYFQNSPSKPPVYFIKIAQIFRTESKLIRVILFLLSWK